MMYKYGIFNIVIVSLFLFSFAQVQEKPEGRVQSNDVADTSKTVQLDDAVVEINTRRPQGQDPNRQDNMGVKFGTDNVLYFPRNISDIFKATWQASNTTALKNNFKFTQTSGNIIFSITNKENTFIPAIDLVQGDMMFRDGEYSTDPALKYTLQGVYFWQIGVLFMVGNPSDYPIVEDFVLDLVANSTIMDSITLADLNAVIQLAKRNLTNSTLFTNTDSLCFFTLLFQFQPVSADFNEKWAFLYRDPRYTSGEIQKPELLFDSVVVKTPNCDLEFSIGGSSFMFESYYNKAINYVVMIGVAAFVEILLTIRQMEASSTQSFASKVSMITIGQQAMMDSYLCLIHLTTGIAVENVFNAFATAAFFQIHPLFHVRITIRVYDMEIQTPSSILRMGIIEKRTGIDVYSILCHIDGRIINCVFHWSSSSPIYIITLFFLGSSNLLQHQT